MTAPARRPVLILGGGASPEAPVSVLTAQNVYRSLPRHKYDPTLLLAGPDGTLRPSRHAAAPELRRPTRGEHVAPAFFERFEASLRKALGSFRGDVALDMFHGVPGEDGSLQRILERNRLRHTGGAGTALAICSSKTRTKEFLRRHGFATPPWFVVTGKRWAACPESVLARVRAFDDRGTVIKPDTAGSSLGLGHSGRGGARAAIEHAFSFDDRVLVERFVPGHEFTCGVFADRDRTRALAPIYRGRTDDGVLTFGDKYLDGGRPRPRLDRTSARGFTDAVRRTVVPLFDALGGLLYCRIDCVVGRAGARVDVLEINPIPFLDASASFCRSLRGSGLDLGPFLDRLIEVAAPR